MDAAEQAASEQARALAGLDLEQLRAVWRERLGPPPGLRSHDHLRRLLAWRLQADALGGLDAEVRRALSARSAAGTVAVSLPVGARLSREWKGVRHEVEITAEGVRCGETLYRSLSEAARQITGVRWNGPRFFGVRGSS